MKSSNAGALLDAKNLIHCCGLSNDSIPCGTRLRACTLFVVADHNWPPSMRGLAYAVGASDLRNAKLPRVRNPDRRRPRYNRPVPVYSPSDLYGDRAVHVGWRGGELVAGRDGDGGARLGRRARADAVRGTTSGETLPGVRELREGDQAHDSIFVLNVECGFRQRDPTNQRMEILFVTVEPAPDDKEKFIVTLRLAHSGA